jgi:hypothetical protein
MRHAHDKKRTLRFEFSGLNLQPRSYPPAFMIVANSCRNCGAPVGCLVNRNNAGEIT